MENIKGFLNTKQIISIFVISFGWLITSGYGLYIINQLKEILPSWAIPILSILTTLLLTIYKILKNINDGTPLEEVKMNAVKESQMEMSIPKDLK